MKGMLMLKINPKFVYNEKGEKIRVIIPRGEFIKIMKRLEDFCDYQMVVERSAKNEKTYTVEEIRQYFGISK
jgi:hypothetical protein